MRRDEAYLLDMLIAVRKILAFTQGLDETRFNSSQLVQSAVIREFQVLGDAARLLSDQTRKQYPQTPWGQIAGLRNRLVHEYFDVHLDVVWHTIQNDIPPLVTFLESIIPPKP